jgi:hypothetical protein
MNRYRDFDVTAPDYQPMAFYSSDVEPADFLAAQLPIGSYSIDGGDDAAGENA